MRVAEGYEIGEDRYIGERGREEKSILYDPWAFPDLLSKFAEILPGDDSKVLEFVHKWGLPGGYLDRSRKSIGMDPVEFIEKHAAIARFALELINLIHQRDSSGVNHYLSTVWPDVERYAMRLLLEDQRLELQKASRMDGLLAGSVVLSALINTHITTGVGPVFQPTEEGVPRRTTKATQLLQVIYCHLADAWDGKQGYYQCENRNCPKWWPTDGESRGPKPKYCPPERGIGESLCGRRERYYLRLERQGSIHKLQEEENND
jgi:hypothetical protein